MKRILIIEDNLEIAELERDFLEASAIESVIETDGTKGLERALQVKVSPETKEALLAELSHENGWTEDPITTSGLPNFS